MSVFFYNIFLLLFRIGIHISSPFNAKAKKWIAGRKNIFGRLEKAISPGERVIWMHCASLGEFEQGRPLIEQLKLQFPGYRILLTFFSPSGYEVQKNYKDADWVFYLPLDGAGNARRFLEIVRPELVIFIKYELWYYYLKKIKYRNIPLLLVSALFRRDMSFFKWYGGLQRKMLSRFDHLFVQNEASRKLIADIGLADICTVSGDTRFDRVTTIAEKFKPIPVIEEFSANSRVIVAGSTWKEDEEKLQAAFSSITGFPLKLIIAPHEINEDHLADIRKIFPDSIFFSELVAGNKQSTSSNILIIDNIGMLSRLYHYGYMTYVGGAFRKSGVHNVLEAAVYGRPVLFGPYYKKYSEAVALVKNEGAICISDADDLGKTIILLLMDRTRHAQHSKKAHDYVWENKGATPRVIQYIQEKRLLTN